MENNNPGFMFIALAIFVGSMLITMGVNTGLKYSATRSACITAGMTADQCVQWNAYWERNSR